MSVFNVCSVENGARIYKRSSESNSKHAPAQNILREEQSLIWTSGEGLPQYIVLDLRSLIKRPKEIRYVAFDFWHDYDSNPRVIEIQICEDGRSTDQEYIIWRVIKLEKKIGKQYFQLDPIPPRFGLIKILIKDTYGASKTYMNQVMLFASNPGLHEEDQVRVGTQQINSRHRRDTRFSKVRQSVQVSSQESIEPRLRQPEFWESEKQHLQRDQRQLQEESGSQDDQRLLMYEDDRPRDSLSGLVRSERHTEDLNNIALLSHNLMGVEENLQTLYRRMELMAERLDKSEKNQRQTQERITHRLEKYVDQKFKEKYEVFEANRGKGKQTQKLLKELIDKLILREKKMNRLKQSR